MIFEKLFFFSQACGWSSLTPDYSFIESAVSGLCVSFFGYGPSFFA
jgi:hypothetical protein